jgi:hypothetical protein
MTQQMICDGQGETAVMAMLYGSTQPLSAELDSIKKKRSGEKQESQRDDRPAQKTPAIYNGISMPGTSKLDFVQFRRKNQA